MAALLKSRVGPSIRFCFSSESSEPSLHNLIIFHQDHPQICTHTENPLLTKRQTVNFPFVNDFLGTIPIKGWKSLWRGFPSTVSSATTVGHWLEQQPWLCFPAAAPLLTLCSNTSQILLPCLGEPLQLIPARQFPQGIIPAHPGASAPHQVWKMSLVLNVLSGLSQPKLF